MSDPIKNSKKRAKQLIGLEMSEKRIKIEMEVLLLKGRIKIRKLWNDLDEFKAKIRVLKNKKNKGKKIIKDIKELESEIEDLKTWKCNL